MVMNEVNQKKKKVTWYPNKEQMTEESASSLTY